jgi:tetratricopeptide (TPR) repeat protein
MPSHGLARIPHTSRTDHRVLRRPQSKIESNLDRPLSLFNPGDRRLPQTEEDRAWGLVLAKIAYLDQNAEVARTAHQKLAAVQPLLPDDNRVLEWLGVCEWMMNRPEQARSRWQEILWRLPKDEAALQRLADLALTQSDLDATKAALGSYLDVNPWHSGYQVRLAAVFGELGLLDGAAQHAKDALRINPTLAPAHRILSEVNRRQGNSAEAARHQRLFQRLEPRK